MLFMLMLGVQDGACILIGNCVGANNIPLAKRFYYFIAKIAIGVIFTMMLTICLLRKQIVSLYTSDQEVIDMVTPIFILISINYLFQGGQCYQQGPIRAMGLQINAAFYTIIAYWVVGIPLSVLLSFWFDFGCFGIYTGGAVADCLQCSSYFYILMRLNW